MSDHLFHNADAERGMIACLVHSPHLFDSVGVSEEHFFTAHFNAVFVAAQEIHRQGGFLAVHTIAAQLGDEGLARIGGIHALLALIEYVPESAAVSLMPKLENAATLRRAYSLLTWANAALQDALRDGEAEDFTHTLSARCAGLQVSGDGEEILGKCVGELCARLDRMDSGGCDADAFPTSLDVWNQAFGGVVRGQMTALVGRPGQGKTALAEQLITDFLAKDKPVLVFEKDMSPTKLIARIACREVGVPYWRLHRNAANAGERERIRRMAQDIHADGLLRLYSPVGLSAEKLSAIARREIRSHKVECIFLDHIQTLSVGRDLREGLTTASLALRRLVTETDVPMIVLAHLNREGDNGRPSPSHVKEFDQLYGDVDGMALLWSDKATAEKDGCREIKFYVGKNRDGAETEETMIFDGARMKFLGVKKNERRG